MGWCERKASVSAAASCLSFYRLNLIILRLAQKDSDWPLDDVERARFHRTQEPVLQKHNLFQKVNKELSVALCRTGTVAEKNANEVGNFTKLTNLCLLNHFRKQQPITVDLAFSAS